MKFPLVLRSTLARRVGLVEAISNHVAGERDRLLAANHALEREALQNQQRIRELTDQLAAALEKASALPVKAKPAPQVPRKGKRVSTVMLRRQLERKAAQRAAAEPKES